MWTLGEIALFEGGICMLKFRSLFGILLLLVFVSLSINCYAQEKSSETVFWEWVSQNENFIYNIDENNDDQMSKVFEQIKKVDEGIGVFIDIKPSNGKRNIFLTAYGNKQKFPIIEKLYKQKPDLKNLEINKYIPRGKLFEPLYIIGKYINPEDICAWLMKSEDGTVKIIFGSSQFDMNYANECLRDIYKYVMREIGEYDLATKIKGVDIQPVNFMSPEVVSLDKFREGFDNLFK
jgi:hypothetical protein